MILIVFNDCNHRNNVINSFQMDFYLIGCAALCPLPSFHSTVHYHMIHWFIEATDLRGMLSWVQLDMEWQSFEMSFSMENISSASHQERSWRMCPTRRIRLEMLSNQLIIRIICSTLKCSMIMSTTGASFRLTAHCIPSTVPLALSEQFRGSFPADRVQQRVKRRCPTRLVLVIVNQLKLILIFVSENGNRVSPMGWSGVDCPSMGCNGMGCNLTVVCTSPVSHRYRFPTFFFLFFFLFFFFKINFNLISSEFLKFSLY